MTLDEVMKSNAFIKNDSAMQFKSPADYIGPFVDIVSKITNVFEVHVSGRVANNNEEIGIQESFPRISVIAKLPAEYNKEGHHYTIGMVYALEIQKPVMKVFNGPRADACLNLAIFNARQVHSVEMLSGVSIIYENAKKYIDTIEAENKEFVERYHRMRETKYVGTKLDAAIGRLLFESMINTGIGTTPILSAAKDLIEPKSVYFAKENTSTEWNLYSAVTEYISRKVDIIDKATKTLLISQVFDKLNRN